MTRQRVFAGSVAAICQYEVAAIVSGRVPTVSALCRTHRWLVPSVLGGLAVHLWGHA